MPVYPIFLEFTPIFGNANELVTESHELVNVSVDRVHIVEIRDPQRVRLFDLFLLF